jgi:hypothetical protein
MEPSHYYVAVYTVFLVRVQIIWTARCPPPALMHCLSCLLRYQGNLPRLKAEQVPFDFLVCLMTGLQDCITAHQREIRRRYHRSSSELVFANCRPRPSCTCAIPFAASYQRLDRSCLPKNRAKHCGRIAPKFVRTQRSLPS